MSLDFFILPLSKVDDLANFVSLSVCLSVRVFVSLKIQKKKLKVTSFNPGLEGLCWTISLFLLRELYLSFR